MKIAFVVQRYGLDVIGGAEMISRQIATHLSRYHTIEVITTCAKDYVTWNNEYPEGTEQVDGITVRRFRNDYPRNLERFGKLSDMLSKSHSREDELEWMKTQGPYSTGLLEFLERNKQSYDMVVFFTYLYCTTYFGLPIVRDRSVLVPTAHDEPWIHMPLFDEVFHLPKGFMYLTEEEERFVNQRFRNRHVPSAVVGVGIDEVKDPDAVRFREKYEIGEKFILYRGRIDTFKGCPELVKYFQRYKRRAVSDLKLVLDGPLIMEAPDDRDIVCPGPLNRTDTFDALCASELTVMPSRLESLSLATLEGWKLGKPALVNGHSAVLRGHCLRSNGGLYYRNYDEFAECLDLLTSDPQLARQLGENGRKYVAENYSWNVVEKKYLSFLDQVSAMMQKPD
jgi:glycosyltransferase involved in cell wall biosynthesis